MSLPRVLLLFVAAPLCTNTGAQCSKHQLVPHYWKRRSRHLCLYACSQSSRAPRLRRPTLDDVERLSRGQAAKNRGTGSRAVPHRLNADEVAEFKRARERGFVTLRGTGYRRERKGSPLANTWRMWSDANTRPTITLSLNNNGQDVVIVDLATLRPASDKFDSVSLVEELAKLANETSSNATASVIGFEFFDTGSVDWESAPTWHLPEITVSWNLQRSDAKSLAKMISSSWITIMSLGNVDDAFTP